MRRQRRAAKRHRLAILEHAVDRMGFAAGRFHALERRHILFHGHHHGAAGQFLDDGVPLHVIAMGMAAKNDLDVGHLEAKLLNGLSKQRHRVFEVGVDEDVTLRRRHQVGVQHASADRIDVSDHFVDGNATLSCVRSSTVCPSARDGIAATLAMKINARKTEEADI